MNDKDKEAYEMWVCDEDILEMLMRASEKVKAVTNMAERCSLLSKFWEKEAWQAACEYKQKEIDELEKEKDYLCQKMENMRSIYKDSEKLQAENAKLREAVEVLKIVSQFSDHDAEVLGLPDGEASTESSKLIKRARQVLKELENK